MAKGPRSVSELAQNRCKMVHRAAIAETEETTRKNIRNVQQLQGGLWSPSIKTLGLQTKSM